MQKHSDLWAVDRHGAFSCSGQRKSVVRLHGNLFCSFLDRLEIMSRRLQRPRHGMAWHGSSRAVSVRPLCHSQFADPDYCVRKAAADSVAAKPTDVVGRSQLRREAGSDTRLAGWCRNLEQAKRFQTSADMAERLGLARAPGRGKRSVDGSPGEGRLAVRPAAIFPSSGAGVCAGLLRLGELCRKGSLQPRLALPLSSSWGHPSSRRASCGW